MIELIEKTTRSLEDDTPKPKEPLGLKDEECWIIFEDLEPPKTDNQAQA